MFCQYCSEEIGKYGYQTQRGYYCAECIEKMTVADVCEEFDITAKEILDEMCNLREVNIEEEEQAEIDDFRYREYVENQMTER